MLFRLTLLAISLVCTAAAAADSADGRYQALDINPARAKFNYQMLCQGCHIPTGEGGRGVPNMNNQVGYFLHLPAGREYLVRVPGSANSALNDERLTELLNWTLLEFGGSSLAADWQPYSVAEVTAARQQPLFEVINFRAQLVEQLQQANYPIAP
jgi:hypothetical protein